MPRRAHTPVLGAGTAQRRQATASGRAAFREGSGEGGPRGGGGRALGLGPRPGLSPLGALSVGVLVPSASSVNNRPSSRSGVLWALLLGCPPGNPSSLSSPVPSGGTPPPPAPMVSGPPRLPRGGNPAAQPPLPPGLAVATASAGWAGSAQGTERETRLGDESSPGPVTGPRTPGPSARGGSGQLAPEPRPAAVLVGSRHAVARRVGSAGEGV